MCLNKKVIAAVLAAGAVVYLLAPQRIGAVAPLLIFAVCPVSMLLMMRAMSGGKCSESARQRVDRADRDIEVAALRDELERRRVAQPRVPARGASAAPSEHAARARAASVMHAGTPRRRRAVLAEK